LFQVVVNFSLSYSVGVQRPLANSVSFKKNCWKESNLLTRSSRSRFLRLETGLETKKGLKEGFL
jgi:hypothetical protein